MTILEEIIEHKRKEVDERASTYPIKLLEQSLYFNTECVSLKKYIQREDKSGIIAEFKRQSPSKGTINAYADVEKVTIGYMQAGASALSVLTDTNYFGGKNQDLTIARKFNYCPILRKDFVIDEYQIIEAKSIGADAILLIASVLSKEQVKSFTSVAHNLGLEVLLEIHSLEEIDKHNDQIELVGINNRNLKTFEVDFENSVQLIQSLPQTTIKIAESGIKSPIDIITLKEKGFDGFLIGESFMRTAEPEIGAKKFIKRIKELEENLIQAV